MPTQTPDLGWLGLTAATLQAADPSGKSAQTFVKGFTTAHANWLKSQNQNDDDSDNDSDDDSDSDTPDTDSDDSDDDSDDDSGGDMPDVSAAPKIPMPQAPPSTNSAAMFKQGVQGMSPLPQVGTPGAPTSLASLASAQPGIGSVMAQKAQQVNAPKATVLPPSVSSMMASTDDDDRVETFGDIAKDSDVWGSPLEPTISNLAKSLAQNGPAHPATAAAFQAALPKLRAYAQSDDADDGDKRYVRQLLSAYSSGLMGQ
jgi:hypothetical protein